MNENAGNGNDGNNGGGGFERAIHTDDPVYKFVTEWNVVLGRYGSTVAQRSSRRKNKKQKDEDSPAFNE